MRLAAGHAGVPAQPLALATVPPVGDHLMSPAAPRPPQPQPFRRAALGGGSWDAAGGMRSRTGGAGLPAPAGGSLRIPLLPRWRGRASGRRFAALGEGGEDMAPHEQGRHWAETQLLRDRDGVGGSQLPLHALQGVGGEGPPSSSSPDGTTHPGQPQGSAVEGTRRGGTRLVLLRGGVQVSPWPGAPIPPGVISWSRRCRCPAALRWAGGWAGRPAPSPPGCRWGTRHSGR